jgi:hypothetical protein
LTVFPLKIWKYPVFFLYLQSNHLHILVGRNQLVGQVLESRKWLYELKQKIVEAKARDEPVWLTITSS